MSFALGLTGSIGMGKSTTAKMFAELGCAIWDADAAVARLYGPGGAAVAPIAARFDGVIKDGQVNRNELRKALRASPDALKDLEAIVHPLVRQDREAFRSKATSAILVFDIPLLFETGSDASMDATVVVSVDSDTQKERVLARGTMTEDDFDLILSKQMPDAEKRARATYIVTTHSLDEARKQVALIVQDIAKRGPHA